MKEKVKRLLLLVLTAVLFTLTAFLFIKNTSDAKRFFQIDQATSNKEKLQKEELEFEVWKGETELKYLDRYCEISKLLPQKNSPIIQLKVDRYETPLEITSPYNPFPGYSKVDEVGTITESDSSEINSNDGKIKLYRIELIKDPNTYIEYVSHRDIPYFYIVKDLDSTEFLFYPSVIQYKELISKKYYIEIL